MAYPIIAPENGVDASLEPTLWLDEHEARSRECLV